jgi:hypothetical protein
MYVLGGSLKETGLVLVVVHQQSLLYHHGVGRDGLEEWESNLFVVEGFLWLILELDAVLTDLPPIDDFWSSIGENLYLMRLDADYFHSKILASVARA